MARRGHAGLAGGALHALALVARTCAILLALLVVALCFGSLPLRAQLLDASLLVADALPAPLSGLLVHVTPFGGAFRGDFALAAVALFVIDWLLERAAAGIGRGR